MLLSLNGFIHRRDDKNIFLCRQICLIQRYHIKIQKPFRVWKGLFFDGVILTWKLRECILDITNGSTQDIWFVLSWWCGNALCVDWVFGLEKGIYLCMIYFGNWKMPYLYDFQSKKRCVLVELVIWYSLSFVAKS